MNPIKLFLLATLFLFGACNGQKKTALQKETVAMNDQLQLLVSDDHSGADVSENLIIRDTKALREFYSKINMTRKPGLPVPEIDFKKEMVIITCSGERNDGSSPVLSVEEVTDSQMVLSTSLKSATKNSAQAITSPFSIYKMPLTDKEIVIDEDKELKNN